MQYKQERREILKSDFDQWGDVIPDKMEKIPQPPLVKAPMRDQSITLPKNFEGLLSKTSLLDVLNDRKTSRKFKETPLSLNELSYLLYFTQGIKRITPKYTFRTVPSGGIRHPFETYLSIRYVEGLTPGIYHYLPETHSIELLFTDDQQLEHMIEASEGQKYVADCAVTFIWSCMVYRTEWRYHMSSYKTILLDAGHVCENLYIAAESIGCGTCAIGKYNQKYLDEYLTIDGQEEFVIYMAPVGKI